MKFNESNTRKKYNFIAKREKELKERIQYVLLSEDYND